MIQRYEAHLLSLSTKKVRMADPSSRTRMRSRCSRSMHCHHPFAFAQTFFPFFCVGWAWACRLTDSCIRFCPRLHSKLWTRRWPSLKTVVSIAGALVIPEPPEVPAPVCIGAFGCMIFRYIKCLEGDMQRMEHMENFFLQEAS